jgi:hypothetical protein
VSGRVAQGAARTPRFGFPAMPTFGACAAAAYRRDAFVGGFDERFFCYFEDVDLAFRLPAATPAATGRGGREARGIGAQRLSQRLRAYHGERNAVGHSSRTARPGLLWMYLPQHPS